MFSITDKLQGLLRFAPKGQEIRVLGGEHRLAIPKANTPSIQDRFENTRPDFSLVPPRHEKAAIETEAALKTKPIRTDFSSTSNISNQKKTDVKLPELRTQLPDLNTKTTTAKHGKDAIRDMFRHIMGLYQQGNENKAATLMQMLMLACKK